MEGSRLCSASIRHHQYAPVASVRCDCCLQGQFGAQRIFAARPIPCNSLPSPRALPDMRGLSHASLTLAGVWGGPLPRPLQAPPVAGILLLQAAVVLWMKLVSYAHCCNDLRSARRDGEVTCGIRPSFPHLRPLSSAFLLLFCLHLRLPFPIPLLITLSRPARRRAPPVSCLACTVAAAPAPLCHGGMPNGKAEEFSLIPMTPRSALIFPLLPSVFLLSCP